VLWLLIRRRRSGEKYAGLPGSALTPPKLVLTVIDGLAPAALERGVADGVRRRSPPCSTAAPTSTTASPRSPP